MATRASDYFNYVWYASADFANTPPPGPTYTPVTIRLESWTTNPATVEWTGQMPMTGPAWPFRIVVYFTTGESATSAMGYITQV